MRFITMVRSAENHGPPPAALMVGIEQLGMDAAKAGVFVETGGLLPTAAGAIARLSNGEITVVDGPFSESKEVIGGYAIFSVASKAEAILWTKRMLDLHRAHWPSWSGEVEIRQLMEFAPPT